MTVQKKKPAQLMKGIFLRVFFSLFIFAAYISFSADETLASVAPGTGSIDIVNQVDDVLVVQGWAGANQAAQQFVSLSIWLADKKIYDGPFEKYERPDVVKVTGRSDWLTSGLRLKLPISDEIAPGTYPTKIVARLDTGIEVTLGNSEQSSNVTVVHADNSQKNQIRLIKIFIVAALLSLAVLFFYTDRISSWVSHKTKRNTSAPTLFGAALILFFFALVSTGLTGSSFSFGLNQAPFIKSDGFNITGSNQGIRSDEWLVLTPLAIAQFNHTPPNPIINTNHGESGQNMLIVGMTGVPVAHLSAIAKPATWGYFVFDLKRALSWNWLFPIFSCLIALWAVVSIMIPGRWRASFLISLLFTSSPYVVAWSNWPAYAVFFPCLIFVCANSIIRSTQLIKKVSLSALLGVAFAGFVFVLYPPWQVSIAYVFIALTIGIVFRDKLYKKFDITLLGCVAVAILVATALIYLWWLDAKSAIDAMENTVYPGQRTTVVGGAMTPSNLLRGFTNIVTLQKIDSPFSNQSEIASFFYLLLPLAFLFLIRARQKMVSALEISIAVAILFILYYMFVGIPTTVAKYSLWGRVPSLRADLALGLSCVILSGLLLAAKPEKETTNLVKLSSFIASVIWAYIVYRSVSALDVTIISNLTTNLMMATVILVATLGYLLSTGRFKAFIYVSLAFSASATALFNPINVAPSKITNVMDNAIAGSSIKPRVLLLENMTPAMYLVASGGPVANGIFYYPQSVLWSRLDPEGVASDVYNRYQHLLYSGDDAVTPKHFSLETPRPDVVRVKVNLEAFDFSLTGANLIAAPRKDQSALSKNTGLAFLQLTDDWAWFSIK